MSRSSASKKPSRIRTLSAETANQIAAGEVVERPASAVKELLENSIDAGATRIKIEIESAGKKLIRISDNGHGMSPEEAGLALERHATSKIQKAEDLAEISTLGFRGEALPSIASVSKLRLKTNDEEGVPGTEIIIEGGVQQSVREVACLRGTTLEVGQIFFNTPARKKFLKADATETSHITQVVTQQALAHPEIHMTLVNNGRKAIDTLPTDQLLYRIAELFGSDLTRELALVEETADQYRIDGYISNPVYTRSNRSAQYFFINQRFIRDKVISHATQHGYSHLLPGRQHPVMFLFLTMNPRLLDVNVHPAKAEVRFAYPQEVHRFVAHSVRNALSRNLKDANGGTGQSDFAAEPVAPFSIPTSREANPVSGSAPAGTISEYGAQGKLTASYSPDQQARLSDALGKFYQPCSASETDEGSPAQTKLRLPVFDQKFIPVSNLIYSEFEPLGQLDNSFILLQGQKGIVVVDQHVAHERVLYERFRDQAKNKKVEIQQLLFPLAMEFSPDEAQLISEHLEMLNGLGLDLESFGRNGFILRSVPAAIKTHDHEKVIREIVEALPKGGGEAVLKERYERIVIMMACRNAIKINQSLDRDQIDKLLYDLERCEMPFTCPHGRPISLLIDMDDLLRRFLRK